MFDNISSVYFDTLLAEGKSNATKRKFGHARHAQGVVERYLIPFFKEAAVGAIRKSKFDEYLAWRKTYWTEGPGKDIDVEEHVRGNSTIKMRFAKKETSDATMTRRPMVLPNRANERWSLDFVSDAFTDGRRFRVLAVVDDFSRECLALVADTSLSGLRMTRELDDIIHRRGKPHTIVSDNGTEMTSMAV